LIVTHVPPWNSPQTAADEAAKAYQGKIEIAEPDAVFEI
jgi:ribonuclease BN (tRNA processing enzyme)